MIQERIVFIVNPVSGVMDKTNIIDLVERSFSGLSVDYDIKFTEKPGHAKSLCHEEIEKGTGLIVAVGGDGTINEIASVLKDTDMVLGIIPSGSGNGLARHLNIPVNAHKALRVILDNNIRKIDTATINDRLFVSIAGVGFDGMVARKFAKSKRRGFVSYFRIVTREFVRYKPQKYTLEFDGNHKKVRALFITFNNSDQFGYNTVIAPRASAADGLLDLCVAHKPPYTAIPHLASLLYWGKIDKSKYMETYRSKEFKVTSKKKPWVNIDGEPVKLGKTLKVKVFPESLNVILPEDN